MSETQVGKGSCLCGSVQVVAATMNRKFGVCHCEMCRKWTGGPFMNVFCGSDVKFDGEEFISIYESSQWAERGFCKKCGSGLFYKTKGKQQYHISIGLFEDFEEITFNLQVFIDKKPEYYSFSNETHNMTKAEIFAKYIPAAES